jgi:hypothetical protein
VEKKKEKSWERKQDEWKKRKELGKKKDEWKKSLLTGWFVDPRKKCLAGGFANPRPVRPSHGSRRPWVLTSWFRMCSEPPLLTTTTADLTQTTIVEGLPSLKR